MGDRPAQTGLRWHRAQLPVTVAAATVLAAAVPGGPPDPGVDRHGLVLVGAVVGGVSLLVLRRRPALAVVVCLVVCTGAQLALGGPTGLVVLVLLALLLAALRLPLRVALALVGVCGLVYLAGDLLTGGFDSRVLAPLAFMVAVTAAGIAVAGQQALVRSATERAAQAERTREAEADRRVADERVRIARELHDVVAHHVAVMGVQAGAAEQLLDTDRDQVRASLAQVRASGRTALTELGAVVGLLRTGTDDESATVAPVAAGMARLPELLESARSAGLRLTVAVDELPALDEVADIAAYRILQESLTNALKHGTGDSDLQLETTPGALLITVRNPIGKNIGTGSGYGLPGMRERAALIGAQLDTDATPDGSFTVRALIPVRRP